MAGAGQRDKFHWSHRGSLEKKFQEPGTMVKLDQSLKYFTANNTKIRPLLNPIQVQKFHKTNEMTKVCSKDKICLDAAAVEVE